MFFVFISRPMFLHDAPRASFVARDSITGMETRRADFTAIVTAVSVTAFAIFAAVFPVHGATSTASARRFGPMGSASAMVWIIFRPQIFSMRS